MLVKPFDPSLDTILVTDAARLHGMGFALSQHSTSSISLIICGSCSLTPCQERYSTVELECLAIVYALKKCRHYLLGYPFHVITDHRPLVGIFNKALHELENPRLLRMREKLTSFTFDISWKEGKSNYIADALSRYPVFPPKEIINEKVLPTFLSINVTQTQHVALDTIRYSTSPEIIELKAYLEGAEIAKSQDMKQYSKYLHDLSLHENLVLFQSSKIVIPRDLKKVILANLHIGHGGEAKTLALAKQLYFWPSMISDVKTFVSNCRPCLELSPSLPNHPIHTQKPSQHSEYPMQTVGTDLFSASGHEYLILVDRFSGYVCCTKLRSTTSAAIIYQLTAWFNLLGWPKNIRSDGGPQYRSDFNHFCIKNNICHELTSPHNPQANGLSESGVKNAKRLLLKCEITGEDFQRSLQAWRNIPRPDGYSPAQLLTGRRQLTGLPTLPSHHLLTDLAAAKDARDARFHSEISQFNLEHEIPTGIAGRPASPDPTPRLPSLGQTSCGDWPQTRRAFLHR